jgi:hypothetical protein
MQYRCQDCGVAITINQTGRRKRRCEDCQKGVNPFSGTITHAKENGSKSASQPIEDDTTKKSHNEEFEPTGHRSRSWKQLRFEEWPQRISKHDRCVTYILTDGKKVNTGYGRASRPLGYVMEVMPGKWVARVGGGKRSEPMALGAAKNAVIALYRSRDKGRPRDWIGDLNRVVVGLIDEQPARPELDAKALRRPIVDLVGIGADQLAEVVSVECKGDTTLLVQSPPEPTLIYSGERNFYLDQIEDVPSGVMPDVPAFLDRRKSKRVEEAAA